MSTERRVLLLGAWRESGLFSGQERATLALTGAMTLLPRAQGNRLAVTSRRPLPAATESRGPRSLTGHHELVVATGRTQVPANQDFGPCALQAGSDEM